MLMIGYAIIYSISSDYSCNLQREQACSFEFFSTNYTSSRSEDISFLPIELKPFFITAVLLLLFSKPLDVFDANWEGLGMF